MNVKSSLASEQEIVITRTFAAPRELVFSAWTEPRHLAQWWGPKNFTNPVCEWDARAGGKIYDVMRGPDGIDYPMGGEYTEIVAPEKLVMTVGALDEKGEMMFEFHHTVNFEEQRGTTTVTIRSRITYANEGSQHYINGYRPGMTQSLERLADLVAGFAAREIVNSRVFAAKPEVVFGAFRDPQQLSRWWGPKGFTNTFKEFDFRPGGRWQFTMHGPDGTDYPNDKTFSEIVPSERIVFRHGQAQHDFVMTMTFTAEATGTKLTWKMLFDSAEECAPVRKFIEEANEQNFDRLAAHLSTFTSYN